MTERHEEAIALQHHPNAHVSDGSFATDLARGQIALCPLCSGSDGRLEKGGLS